MNPIPITGRKRERIDGNSETALDDPNLSFFESSRAAASTVGRVVHNLRGWQGTGFMISNHLFMTNNHVIRNLKEAREFAVEFNYELDTMNAPKPVSKFALAPNSFFMASPEDELDFTLAAIGNRVSGEGRLHDFGFCPIKDLPNKVSVGMLANIIGHPEGRFKQMGIRNNRVVALNQEVLHYYAQLEVGSSGSPLFNDYWEPIALHHWGAPTKVIHTPDGKPGPRDVNEGIRIDAITKKITSAKDGLSRRQRALIEDALFCEFTYPSLLRRKKSTREHGQIGRLSGGL